MPGRRPTRPGPRRTWLYVVGVVGVISLIVASIVVYLQKYQTSSQSVASLSIDNSVSIGVRDEQARIQMFDDLLALVVEIRPDTLFRHIQGSGVIVDVHGHILTAAHVMDNAAQASVSVVQSDGTRDVYTADLIGVDPCHDLALLRLPEDVQHRQNGALSVAANVNVGEQVLAMGYYMNDRLGNQIDPALTTGTASRVGASYLHHTTLIEHQAYVNPGSSGGPLFNDRGQLIGVNVIRIDSGLFYAIAGTVVADVFERLTAGLPPSGLPALDIDAPVTGTIRTVDEIVCHTFTTNVQHEVVLSAIGTSGLDPLIELYESNRLFAYADDINPPENLNAELRFTAQPGVTYVILLRSTSYGPNGDYTLAITG